MSGRRPAAVVAVLPGEVADPTQPSGGNTYDLRICQGLAAVGWSVRKAVVPGRWPQPEPAARAQLAQVLASVPDDAYLLLDGLVGSGVPELLRPHATRLRIVVLLHLPLAAETGLPPQVASVLDGRERESLTLASAVVATSPWTARWLLTHHQLPAERVQVVTPGTDPAAAAPGTEAGTRLLCVAALTPRKGQDVLVAALAALADRPWRCELVGPTGRAPEFVAALRAQIGRHGLGDRIRLTGPRTGADLAATYAVTDLLVLPSRAETYGMVVTEALARAIPVLASGVDGVPETVGYAPDGGRPGLLVAPGEPVALADGLRRWLTDGELRARLRSAAGQRRATLPGWGLAAQQLSQMLRQLVPVGRGAR